MASEIKTNKSERRIKRPIRRTLFIRIGVLAVLLSALFSFISYRTMSKTLYDNYNDKLTEVMTYIANNMDADDLEKCVETGVMSEKYKALQAFLNGIIDDLKLDYLYTVIPMENVLVNVISATSQAERDAGETDMPLLETTDAYSPEEIAIYRSFWDSETVGFFEESSDYGAFYTGCRPLRNSAGKTVALICADISLDTVYASLNRVLLFSVLFAVLTVCIFAVIVLIWIRKEITKPLLALENSAIEYSQGSSAENGALCDLHFNKPTINTGNEVQSLGDAISRMTDDMSDYVDRIVAAELRIEEAERENERLTSEARANAKIAELSNSVLLLLNNMPALSYMKDIETGKYLSCNAKFAEYAGKATPEEVVGLTDKDIYDPAIAENFVAADRRTVELDHPNVYFEDAADGMGNPRQFQTTKLKFVDTDGHHCILGMSIDVTEMMQLKLTTEKAREAFEKAQSQSVTYSNLAHALSLDYKFLYYIDLETDYFIEYGSDAENESIVEKRSGSDFFGESRRDAQKLIYEDDLEMFFDMFTKERILKMIEEHGVFTMTYRMIVDGDPVYMNMKATGMKDGRHIIFGIYSVDEQMRYQEAAERVKEEQITYARINALSGEFICIYTVDPETEHYSEYSSSAGYSGLGLAKEGEDFFARSAEDIEKVIYPEDIERFRSVFSKEKVMEEIAENGIFVTDYRLMMSGAPVYVSLKAALVKEKDKPQLIFGVVNIDRQVKRDQEYEYNLSVERTKANVDALTGVKNKHAYVDVESSLNRSIEEGEDVNFALAVFDVNGLKRTNDTEGHRAGDELIKNACSIICGIFKHSPVFRIGGDEFAVIAQGEDLANLDELVGKIGKINEENNSSGGAVVACGAAVYNGERSVSAVFERADSLMYENKKRLKDEKPL